MIRRTTFIFVHPLNDHRPHNTERLKHFLESNGYYIPDIFHVDPTCKDMQWYILFINFYHRLKTYGTNYVSLPEIISLLKLDIHAGDMYNTKLGWDYYMYEFFSPTEVRRLYLEHLYACGNIYAMRAMDPFWTDRIPVLNDWLNDFFVFTDLFDGIGPDTKCPYDDINVMFQHKMYGPVHRRDRLP